MTEGDPGTLAAAEPSVTNFAATVGSVDGREVVLDRTYFYPESGGQPADRGAIGDVGVADVQKREGTIVHTLETEPPFAAGESVEGEVDAAFRTYTTRAHTASHVVYGAGRELLADHGYGGFDIGEDRIRLDFATSEDVGSVSPLTIQRMANEVVWESRPVEWYAMDADAAAADDEIIFNLGEDAGAADTVRIVEIEGWDVAACGGTHVTTTAEIGPIAVLEVSNPGADLVRVEFAVGPRAIERIVADRKSATRAATALDTNVAELPQRAETLREENESLQAEIDRLGERLLDAQLRGLEAETRTRGDEEWYVGTVEATGANAVAERVGELTGEAADVIAVAGADDATFLVVGTTGETDASQIVADVTAEFGGGGGGRPVLAQGGGMDADPAVVAEYIRDEAGD